MSERPLVAHFSELGTRDHSLVGEYGTNLGHLVKAGATVPHGFCLTTEAWASFRKPIEPRLKSLLAAVETCSPDDQLRLGELAIALQRVVLAAEVPDAVTHAILGAMKTLGGLERFAVRPSPTFEATAGEEAWQEGSSLNIRSRDVPDAIRACWARLYSASALAFRRRARISDRSAGMAVLVQKMLHPRVSGVMLTADPTSNVRGIATVTATWGLWDGAHDGRGRCDRYRLDLASGSCFDAEIAEKRYAIVPSPDVGVEEITVEVRRSTARLLSATDCAELARLGRRLQDHFDTPQEVHWALVDDAYRVIRSHPIRTIFPLPAFAEGRDSVWMSLGHVVDDTEPLAPLSLDTWQIMAPGPHWLSARGGRLFVDIAGALASERLTGMLSALLRDVAPDTATALAGAAQSVSPSQRSKLSRGVTVPVTARTLAIALGHRTDDLQWSMTEQMRSFVRGWEAVFEKAEDASETVELVRQMLAELWRSFFRARWIPELVAGAASVRALLDTPGVDAQSVWRLMEAELAELVDPFDAKIRALAQLAARNPDLAAWLAAAHEYEVGGGRMLPDTREFWQQWDRVIDEYGHRSPNVLDIAVPCWRHDPHDLRARVIQLIGEPTDPDGPAQESVETLREGLLLGVTGARRMFVSWLLGNVSRYIHARHAGRDALEIAFEQIRTTVLLVGVALQRAKRLARSDDVFWLGFEELDQAIKQARPMFDVVATNRSRHVRFRELHPPRLITAGGELPALEGKEFCMVPGVALES